MASDKIDVWGDARVEQRVAILNGNTYGQQYQLYRNQSNGSDGLRILVRRAIEVGARDGVPGKHLQ